ncbi:uncharacterized protein [Tenebrio molitor]|jgi:ribosome silencing factor RsfS/YbeB/iojap|uniref:uncharacterized protein n=1 Tax=Tenebrio molitor TaxID=7067 RepID=UPI003624A005
MFMIKVLHKVRPQKQCLYLLQACVNHRMKTHKSDKHDVNQEQIKNTTNQTLGEMSSKYQVFREEDSEVILDIYEERNKYLDTLEQEEDLNPLSGVNLERGKNGVYEIEDLVDVLRRENAEDIFVASVPNDIKYVDYMCIVSGKSHRHMKAIAQFVRKIYKKKMHKTDLIPILEGEASKDWMALDLGNIALHIFSREARTLYDLDSLWSVGSQYDKECNKQDPITEMLERHSIYLQDLHPAN